MNAEWWQLLIASGSLFIAIGGIFVAYIKAVTKTDSQKLVAVALTAFRENELNPIVERITQEVHKIADMSSRLGNVEGGVHGLSVQSTQMREAIGKNADQHRNDITGLGQRLEAAAIERDRMLVELIKAHK